MSSFMFLAVVMVATFAILLLGFPGSADARKRKGKYRAVKAKSLKGKCGKAVAALNSEMEANPDLGYDLVTSTDRRGRPRVLARCTADGTIAFKGECVKNKFRYRVPGSSAKPPMKQLTPKRLGKTVDVQAADTCTPADGWILGELGASCHTACSQRGLSACNALSMGQLYEPSEAFASEPQDFVMLQLGLDPSQLTARYSNEDDGCLPHHEAAPHLMPQNPGYAITVAAQTPTCGASNSQVQRICCCSTDYCEMIP